MHFISPYRKGAWSRSSMWLNRTLISRGDSALAAIADKATLYRLTAATAFRNGSYWGRHSRKMGGWPGWPYGTSRICAYWDCAPRHLTGQRAQRPAAILQGMPPEGPFLPSSAQ
jgi:hypothetical protein